MPAVHLTTQALDFLEHILATRVEPGPMPDSIRRTLRTERDRAAALDELAHPFTSAAKDRA